jgi:hypothetical protein
MLARSIRPVTGFGRAALRPLSTGIPDALGEFDSSNRGDDSTSVEDTVVVDIDEERKIVNFTVNRPGINLDDKKLIDQLTDHYGTLIDLANGSGVSGASELSDEDLARARERQAEHISSLSGAELDAHLDALAAQNESYEINLVVTADEKVLATGTWAHVLAPPRSNSLVFKPTRMKGAHEDSERVPKQYECMVRDCTLQETAPLRRS